MAGDEARADKVSVLQALSRLGLEVLSRRRAAKALWLSYGTTGALLMAVSGTFWLFLFGLHPFGVEEPDHAFSLLGSDLVEPSDPDFEVKAAQYVRDYRAYRSQAARWARLGFIWWGSMHIVPIVIGLVTVRRHPHLRDDVAGRLRAGNWKPP
jgi:hypothetical protein